MENNLTYWRNTAPAHHLRRSMPELENQYGPILYQYMLKRLAGVDETIFEPSERRLRPPQF